MFFHYRMPPLERYGVPQKYIFRSKEQASVIYQAYGLRDSISSTQAFGYRNFAERISFSRFVLLRSSHSLYTSIPKRSSKESPPYVAGFYIGFQMPLT